MKPEIQVDVRSLFLGVGIVVVLTAVFTVSVFSMGQQNGLRLAGGAAALPGSPDPASGVIKSPTEELPALPKAVTATPQANDRVMITLSETQANQFAMDQVSAGGIEQVLQVQQILFTESAIELSGVLNAQGFMGEFEMNGKPVVQSQGLHFAVSSLEMDGQALPQFLFPLIEQEVDALFDQLLSGYVVEEVQLSQGQLSMLVRPW